VNGTMSDSRLSRQERQLLDALEDALVDDDPAFVEQFAAESRGLDGKPSRLRRRSRGGGKLRWLRALRRRE
jgi:hypothetical protein